MNYTTADRTQRVNEKNGITCSVIMFTQGLVVIKMSKIANFLFSADGSKKSVTFWAKYLSASENLI